MCCRSPGLRDSLGDVLACGQTGHVAPGGVLAHGGGFAADDGHQFDFPVHVAPARDGDGAVGPGEARHPLREYRGQLGRDVEAGLGGMLAVVQPDRENLPR